MVFFMSDVISRAGHEVSSANLAGANSRKPTCPLSGYNQIMKNGKKPLNLKSSILSCIIVQA